MLSTSTNEIIAVTMWHAVWVSVLMPLTFSELVSKGIIAFLEHTETLTREET